MYSQGFSCGDKYTFADIFLYTNVRTTQLCSKFEDFRQAFGGDPFAEYPHICAIADKVQARPKISSTADKFAKMPF